MADNPNKGLNRLINASRFSWQGVKACYLHEEAFRQEAWLLVVALPIIILFASNIVEAALMLAAIIFVMLVELLNSAIEATVDRVSKDKHLLSGRAKDMASAAVTFSIFIAILVWLVCLFN